MKILTWEWHNRRNAAFQDFFGCEIPAGYGDCEKEYWAIRKSAGFRDVSYFGKIRVAGKDGRDFLHRMLTNDIRALNPGAGSWALLLDDRGRIQSDMKIYCLEDDSLLIVLPHYMREKITAELERYIITEDVRLEDATSEWAMVQLLGPQAGGLLHSRGITPPNGDYSFVEADIGGAGCKLIRLPLAYALLTPASSAEALLDNLRSSQPIGMEAFNTFRIEAGLPLMHVDMDETNLPQECRQDGALNFHKGCYLGQETIARLDARGHVNRKLCGLTAAAAIRASDRVRRDGAEIGHVTSVALSPLLKQPVALAYLKSEFAAAGQAVEVGDDNTIAVVTNLPVRES